MSPSDRLVRAGAFTDADKKADRLLQEAMQTDRVLADLRAEHADLRAVGVESLYLFGSLARGEAQADSDVDLFFDHRPGLSLFDVMALRERLEARLGRPVDLMTRQSLHPYLRPRIEAEALQVF